jgi:hypothetical protein
MGSFVVIERSKIRKSPHNRRLERNQKAYKALIASMKSRGFDQAHPLRVRPVAPLEGLGEAFELIGGETRYDAGCEVGLSEFPCLVEELSDLEAIVELAADNEQTPFSPMEKALLLKDFRNAGGVIATVLPRFGLSEPEASKLSKALQVFEHAVTNGCAGASLSSKHDLLYEVSRLPKDQWIGLAGRISAGELTRAILRERVNGQTTSAKPEGKSRLDHIPPPVEQDATEGTRSNSERAGLAAVVISQADGSTRPSGPKALQKEEMRASNKLPVANSRPAEAARDTEPSKGEVIANQSSSKAAARDAGDVGGWLPEEALAEIYVFPSAPPGWGWAKVHGVPGFGPLKQAGGHAVASVAPSMTAPPTPLPAPPLFRDIDALIQTLSSAALTEELLEAVERVAPDASRTEIRVFDLPESIADSFDLAFGEGAEWFRAISVRPHDDQRKVMTGMMLSFISPEQVYHDEERPRLRSQRAAVVYGRISASSSRQHVMLVAAVTLEDDGSGPTGIATTVIGKHVVQLPECRLHTDGGGAPSRLFAVAARRV